MPKGFSLHIGLNAVDPVHYQGWSGPLNACEADAEDMARIADRSQFSTQTLLTQHATRQAVREAILQAADRLEPGDTFLLTYSGHGGQIPDQNGDEWDGLDETWCLYDGEQVDDELYSHLQRFRSDVRVVVLSDSCHSGTVVKLSQYAGASPPDALDGSRTSYRAMPLNVARRTYEGNLEMYDEILRNPATKNAKAAIQASCLLISGCQDNQLSADGAFNGLFTGNLLLVWANGKFEGSYLDFYKRILYRMPKDQTPNYYTIGPAGGVFSSTRPFSI